MEGFELPRTALSALLSAMMLLGVGGALPTTARSQEAEESGEEVQQAEEAKAAEEVESKRDEAEPEEEGETPASIPAADQPAEPPLAERAAEDESLTLVAPGTTEATESQSLVEAARAERQRRRTAEQPSIVITNKNLPEFATGELTISDAPETVDIEAPAEGSAEANSLAQDEAYWRRRGREIRIAWREAVEAIPETESRVAELRMAFYQEDDGFYRDQEIKPAWDKALRDLEEARRQAVEKEKELEEFLEEGRRAGALPGWLREGIELEPEVEREPSTSPETFEPMEPEVIEEPEGGGERP